MSMASGVQADADAGLLKALRRDDPDAAVQLVERYGHRVYQLAMRVTGMSEDAEGAALDALWTVARTVHTFNGESTFGSWIDRVTAKAAYQKLRARRQTVSEIALEDLTPSLDGDGRHFAPMEDWSKRVDERVLREERPHVLTDAIDALPADYRTALVLHDVEGLSNADIAETLDLSVPAMKSRVHWARLFVRKRLSEYLKSAERPLR